MSGTDDSDPKRTAEMRTASKKEPSQTMKRDPKPGILEALAKSLLRRVRPYDKPKPKQR